MFEMIKNMFNPEKIDFAKLVADGAIILDVRSNGEFASGHIKGSVNIPVNKLTENLNRVKAGNKAIITCCASGTRSATAKTILESKGYSRVYNGGGWLGLKHKINQNGSPLL